MPNRSATRLLTALICSCIAQNLFAQLPNPVLNEMFPRGMQLGTTADVTASGRDLDELSDLLFSHPGIQATVKTVSPSEFEAARTLPNQFAVEVAENVPPGIYEARTVGRFGVSTPLPFFVHQETQAIESGDNHSVDKAIPVLIPGVIHGRCDPNQTDFFKVSLDAGTTLAIHCLAAEISSRVTPVVAILSNDGRPLQRSRAVRDTTMTHTFAQAGEYLVSVHDGIFGGGNEYPYALHITNGPVVDLVLPAAALPGSIAEFTFYGRNNANAMNSPFQLRKHQLTAFNRKVYVPTKKELAASHDTVAGIRGPSFRAPFDGDSASASEIAIGFSNTPVQVEIEPNEREHATAVNLPVEYSGTFYPRRDQDWIRFAATKGQRLQIEVRSAPGGIEIDPAVYVWRVATAKGGKETFVNRNVTDDAKLGNGRYGRRIPRALDHSEPNPTVTFVVPEDGDYCVSTRDLYGNARNDPRAAYRMIVKPADPTFRLIAWTQRYRIENNNKRVERASLALYAGESREVMVDVIREDGFQGEILLSAEGLPPGVHCEEMVVTKGQTEAAVVLTAAKDAKPTYSSIQIVGKANIQGKAQSKRAAYGLLTSDVGNIAAERPTRRPVGSIFVSVKGTSEKAPAIVTLGDKNTLHTSVGATLKIPATLENHAELKGELKMNSIELPGEVKPKEVALKSGASGTVEIAFNNKKVQPGRYSFFMTGQVAAKVTRNQAAISAAEKVLADFDVTLKSLQSTIDTATENKGDENAFQLATAKKQRADQFRKTLEERVNQLKKQNGPRDVQVVVTSTPVTVHVSKSPLSYGEKTIATKIPSAGDATKGDAELAIERRFGFVGPVELTIVTPDGYPTIAIDSIPKEETKAKISYTITPETKAGRYTYDVSAKLKFGGVDIADSLKITLDVSAPANTQPGPADSRKDAADTNDPDSA